MVLTSWDIEVHAREMRERRQHHAARARLLDEAVREGRMPESSIVSRIAAVASEFVSRFVRGEATRQSGKRRDEEMPAARARSEEIATPVSRPRREADPFADMVVIARGDLRRATRRVGR